MISDVQERCRSDSSPVSTKQEEVKPEQTHRSSLIRLWISSPQASASSRPVKRAEVNAPVEFGRRRSFNIWRSSIRADK